MKKIINYFLLFLINFLIMFLYCFAVKYFILIPNGYSKLPFEHGNTSLLYMVISILFYSTLALVLNYFFKQNQPPLRNFAYLLLSIISVDVLFNIVRYRLDFVSALGNQLSNFSVFFFSFYSIYMYRKEIIK